VGKCTLLCIALPDRKVVSYKELFIDYPIQIHGHNFLVDLYKFELTDFNIIMGMD